MRISRLIEELEEARVELGEDAEVRIAYQPNWPLRAEVAAVTADPGDEDGEDEPPFAWIAAGDQPYDENPYAPKSAWGES